MRLWTGKPGNSYHPIVSSAIESESSTMTSSHHVSASPSAGLLTGSLTVLAYDVSQRTREIGVRSAIGASRGQISSLILRQGLWKGGIGVALGLIGAVVLSRFMTSLLFNVKPTDPAVYATVSSVLIGVALLASYL